MDETKAIDEVLGGVLAAYQPSWNRLKALRSQLIEDSIGDESLEVWVVVDDQTTDSEVLSGLPRQIENSIREGLAKRSVTRFPYVYFAREREYPNSY